MTRLTGPGQSRWCCSPPSLAERWHCSVPFHLIWHNDGTHWWQRAQAGPVTHQPKKLSPHPDDAEPDLVEEFLAERLGGPDVPFDDRDRG